MTLKVKLSPIGAKIVCENKRAGVATSLQHRDEAYGYGGLVDAVRYAFGFAYGPYVPVVSVGVGHVETECFPLVVVQFDNLFGEVGHFGRMVQFGCALLNGGL